MDKDTIRDVIVKHRHWLLKDVDNWESYRADFAFADLTGADLSDVNLTGANFRGAILNRADLHNTTLNRADLTCALLCDADLSHSMLYKADLQAARLPEANLRYADFEKCKAQGADFSGANLSFANLRFINLNAANLRNAVLYGANLNGADLTGVKVKETQWYGSNLTQAKHRPFIPMACPDTGPFVGWKKVDGLIVKLFIPEDARRCSGTTRKCRADKAFVAGIENVDGSCANVLYVVNHNYKATVYEINTLVYPDFFDENRFNECSHGIHFFINRQDAVEW